MSYDIGPYGKEHKTYTHRNQTGKIEIPIANTTIEKCECINETNEKN